MDDARFRPNLRERRRGGGVNVFQDNSKTTAHAPSDCGPERRVVIGLMQTFTQQLRTGGEPVVHGVEVMKEINLIRPAVVRLERARLADQSSTCQCLARGEALHNPHIRTVQHTYVMSMLEQRAHHPSGKWKI